MISSCCPRLATTETATAKHCTITGRLDIVAGRTDDYQQLAHYHYRQSQLGPVAEIYALKPRRPTAGLSRNKTVGVIVYTMPIPGLRLRNIATGGLFTGLDRATLLALINQNIRSIGRVIIEPRLRGLGLASRLVRETMPSMNVPIIEALAVMGWVNPFFEKAGMKAYTAKTASRCAQLIEALDMVGIQEQDLIDARKVQRKLMQLPAAEADFIERQIRRLLQSYRTYRDMSPGLQRTKYVLSKLTARPVYYIWFNPHLAPHQSEPGACVGNQVQKHVAQSGQLVRGLSLTSSHDKQDSIHRH